MCHEGVAGVTRSCPGGEQWGEAVMRSISAKWQCEQRKKWNLEARCPGGASRRDTLLSAGDLASRGRGAFFVPLPKGCGMAGSGIRRLCVVEAQPEWHSAVRAASGTGKSPLGDGQGGRPNGAGGGNGTQRK